MASSSKYTSQYNLKSPAVKRIMKEASELRFPTDDYFAQPLEENLFEWHFTIRGTRDSCFSQGVYHGKILLPTDYPLKPPQILFFTPNGRWVTNKKICLTISGHHPETWLAGWSIRTILLALIGFMTSEGLGTIGSLDYSNEERIELAKKSVNWSCNVCGKINDLVKEREESTDLKKDDNLNKLEEKDRELMKMIVFKADVDQPIVKQPTKIDNLDLDSNDNLNRQNTLLLESSQSDRRPNESINGSTSITQPMSNNNSLLSRLSPTLIVVMIIVLLLRRFYMTFF